LGIYYGLNQSKSLFTIKPQIASPASPSGPEPPFNNEQYLARPMPVFQAASVSADSVAPAGASGLPQGYVRIMNGQRVR